MLQWTQDRGAAQRLAWRVAEALAQELQALQEPQAGARDWLAALASASVPCACVSSLDRCVSHGLVIPRWAAGGCAATRPREVCMLLAERQHNAVRRTPFVVEHLQQDRRMLIFAGRLCPCTTATLMPSARPSYALSLLDSVRGMPATSRSSLNGALERMGIAHAFVARITAEDGMDTHAQQFLAAAIQLQRAPNRCVAFAACPLEVTAAHNCTMKVRPSCFGPHVLALRNLHAAACR